MSDLISIDYGDVVGGDVNLEYAQEWRDTNATSFTLPTSGKKIYLIVSSWGTSSTTTDEDLKSWCAIGSVQNGTAREIHFTKNLGASGVYGYIFYEITPTTNADCVINFNSSLRRGLVLIN